MNAADLLDGTLYGLAGTALVASGYAVGCGRTRKGRLLAAAGCGLLAAECALAGSWFGAAWNAALLAVLLGWDFWDRKGKRAARSLGAKSRALVEGLAEKLRGALQPVPEGAGA